MIIRVRDKIGIARVKVLTMAIYVITRVRARFTARLALTSLMASLLCALCTSAN